MDSTINSYRTSGVVMCEQLNVIAFGVCAHLLGNHTTGLQIDVIGGGLGCGRPLVQRLQLAGVQVADAQLRGPAVPHVRLGALPEGLHVVQRQLLRPYRQRYDHRVDGPHGQPLEHNVDGVPQRRTVGAAEALVEQKQFDCNPEGLPLGRGHRRGCVVADEGHRRIRLELAVRLPLAHHSCDAVRELVARMGDRDGGVSQLIVILRSLMADLFVGKYRELAFDVLKCQQIPGVYEYR
jgi:hypothetical protein